METDAVCIPNISAAERRRRLKGGVIMFVIGLAVLLAMVATAISLLLPLSPTG